MSWKAPMIGKVAIIVALPLVVFWGGVWQMSEMSNRQYVLDRLGDSDLPSYEKLHSTSGLAMTSRQSRASLLDARYAWSANMALVRPFRSTSASRTAVS